MILMVDDTRSAGSPASIEEAIRLGALAAQGSGRQVVEVHVDGRRLSNDELASPARLCVKAREVRLVTMEPGELLRETMIHAVHALDSIADHQHRAADLVQQDRIPDAMHDLGEAISLWQMVQEATVKGAHLSATSASRGDAAGSEALQTAAASLNDHLRRMADALRTRDRITLTDILLYEMPSVIARWRTVLPALAMMTNDASAA